MTPEDQPPEKQNSDSADLAKIADFDINNLDLEATEKECDKLMRERGFVKIPVFTRPYIMMTRDGELANLGCPNGAPIMCFKD